MGNNERGRREMRINLAGPAGNIFAVMGLASRFLSEEDAKTMQNAVTSSHSYEDALNAINGYVQIVDLSGMYNFE